ncbi:MAG: BRO family protein [Gemmatimonadaceae bacterium]
MDNGSLFDSGDAPQGGTSGELQPYEFPFTGEHVRAGLIDGEPWLVAPDVCFILKHSNVTMAVKGLDDDEHRTIYRGSSEALNFPDLFADQRIQSVKLINESGLYSLVLRSKVPAAKEFKKWVTAVLRQIRQTGSYGVPQQFDPSNLDHVAQIAQLAADQKRQIEARDEKIAELLPGHELSETYAAANGTMTVQTFARTVQQWATARKIKVNQDHVFDFLGQIGMLIRSKARSDYGQATAQAIKSSWCENATKDIKTRTRGVILTTYARLTPQGVDHAWKRIHQVIGEFGTLDPKVIRP